VSTVLRYTEINAKHCNGDVVFGCCVYPVMMNMFSFPLALQIEFTNVEISLHVWYYNLNAFGLKMMFYLVPKYRQAVSSISWVFPWHIILPS